MANIFEEGWLRPTLGEAHQTSLTEDGMRLKLVQPILSDLFLSPSLSFQLMGYTTCS